MVSGSRNEGGTQILSAGVRKTIQSIKEIVGNHSDIDIYWALKETNMDPNETAQKLLNQGGIHAVVDYFFTVSSLFRVFVLFWIMGFEGFLLSLSCVSF